MNQPPPGDTPDLVHPERAGRPAPPSAPPARPATAPDAVGPVASPVAPDTVRAAEVAVAPDTVGSKAPPVAPDSLLAEEVVVAPDSMGTPVGAGEEDEPGPAPEEDEPATAPPPGTVTAAPAVAVEPAAPEPGGALLVLASGLLALLLVASAAVLGLVAVNQATAAWDLNFESPNLATIRLFQAGVNPYADAVREGMPFQWALYTPVYHWLVSLVPASPELPFTAGRVLSVIAGLAAMLAVVVAPATRRGRIVALALVVTWGLAWPVASALAYLKNDLLALAFAAWAVTAAMLAGRAWPEHPRRATGLVVLAGVLVVLAFASKQSYLAAAAAIAAWLLLAGPRRLLPGYVASAGLGLGAFAVLAQLAWGGGFWTSILNTASHPVTLAHALFVLGEVAVSPAAWLLGIAGLVALPVLLVRGGWRGLVGSLPAWWFLAAMAVLVVTIGKLGSGSNYVYEPLLAAALLAATAVEAVPRLHGYARSLLPAGLAVLLLAGLAGAIIGWQDTTLLERGAWHLRQGERGGAATGALPATETWQVYRAEVGQVLGERRGVPILNLSTAQYQYAGDERGPFQDQAYLNDAFLYLGLYETGVLDPQPLADAIRDRRFAVIVRAPVDQVALGRVPVLRQALEDHYRLVRTGGLFDYWVPR